MSTIVCKHGYARESWQKTTCPQCLALNEPHEDITERRHGGNRFSNRANPEASRKAADMEAIYQGFVKAGPAGAIREDVYLPLGYEPQTGSARCADLKRNGRIIGTGRSKRTRLGASAEIMVADCYAHRAQTPEEVVEFLND